MIMTRRCSSRQVNIVLYAILGVIQCNSVSRDIPRHAINTPAMPAPPTKLMPATTVMAQEGNCGPARSKIKRDSADQHEPVD
jgi:hypothetical protein